MYVYIYICIYIYTYPSREAVTNLFRDCPCLTAANLVGAACLGAWAGGDPDSTPCGGEALHACFKMSRAKDPM